MRPAALFALSVAACSGPAPTPPRPVAPPVTEVESAPPDAAPVGPPGIKVTLADVGLEAGSLDRTADPCVDFYQFACGGWLAANDIPVGRPGWSRFAALEEKNKAAIKVILEEAAKGIGADPSVRKLGDFYASCMDEAAIEQTGLASIKPLLDKAAKVKDAASWLAMTIELHKLGVWVVWSVEAAADLRDSSTTATYLQPGLLGGGLRDWYIEEGYAHTLAEYKAHVARTLVLAGVPEAKAITAAADVVAIETELAQGARPGGVAFDLKALGKRVTTVDWNQYFQSVGYEPSKSLRTWERVSDIDRVRKRFPPARWASYFTYHIIADATPQLPQRFRDEAFALEKLQTDATSPPDRSEQCIEQTQEAVGDLLGQRFVAKYFTTTARQDVTTLVDALVHALGTNLDASKLSDAIKQEAHAKLATLDTTVGYPDSWHTYDFEVRRDDFAGNRTRARMFATLRALDRAGKPVDRSTRELPMFQVAAYYSDWTHHASFPAGLLQTPFFSRDRSIPANLGGLALTVAHELTHSLYDTPPQNGTCLIEQYSTFEAAPNEFVDGRRTWRENLADLGGVKIAFDAYRAARADAGKVYVADGFTEDQQFFLAVAQASCSKSRPEEMYRQLASGRAPPNFRVYGALRNLPAFTQAFRCAPGTPMNPTNVCNPW